MFDFQWARKGKTLGLQFEAQLTVLSTPVIFFKYLLIFRASDSGLVRLQESHICHSEEEMLKNTNVYSH